MICLHRKAYEIRMHGVDGTAVQLEKLSIFLQIVDTGSVSAAARLVHLSQPAVSRNLQQLEDDFGVSLFEREGRGLRLTAAGRALVPEARAILSRFEALRKSVRGTAERSYHDLRLGTVDSVVSFLFGHLVAPLRDAFPELGLKLTTGRTAQLLERVANDDLDLALVAYSGVPPAERVSRVARYDLQYYGRRDRFAELALATTDAEIAAGFPLVEIEALPGQPTMIPGGAKSFARAGSLASVKALVLGGFGVGSLLDFMLREDERQQLVRAGVPHDPNCAIYLAAGPGWRGARALEIEACIVEHLRPHLCVD